MLATLLQPWDPYLFPLDKDKPIWYSRELQFFARCLPSLFSSWQWEQPWFPHCTPLIIMHWKFSGTTIVPKHLNPEFLPGFFLMSFCPELTTVKYRRQSNFQNWTSILQKRLIWPHICSELFNFKHAKRTSVKLVLEISTVPPAMIIPTHLK